MNLSNDVFYFSSGETVMSDGGSSSYYELPPDCQGLLDVIVRSDMGFLQGEIFKAAYRWDKKPDLEYNLNKIIFFAEYELKRLYKTYPGNPRADDEPHQ